MKIQVGVLTLIMVLFIAGCSTQSAKHARSLSNSIRQQGRAYKAAVAKSGADGASWEATIVTRSNEVMRVQQRFDEQLTTFSKRLMKLTSQAQLFGISQVGIRWAGLASGIGGAAAAAASPANVVWVTALSGFSGAANGFGAAADTEGYSKAIVANFLKPMVDKVATAVNGFSLAEAQEYMWEKDGTKFWAAIKEQNKNVGVISGANIELLQPPTAPATSAPAPPAPKPGT